MANGAELLVLAAVLTRVAARARGALANIFFVRTIFVILVSGRAVVVVFAVFSLGPA